MKNERPEFKKPTSIEEFSLIKAGPRVKGSFRAKIDIVVVIDGFTALEKDITPFVPHQP